MTGNKGSPVKRQGGPERNIMEILNYLITYKFWVTLGMGIFIGAMMGFSLAAILSINRENDIKAELESMRRLLGP